MTNIRRFFVSFLSLLAVMVAWCSPILAQGPIDEDIQYGQLKSHELGESVCAFSSVKLYNQPNEGGQVIEEIRFMQLLKNYGDYAYNRSERREYLHVLTSQGNEGWINERFVVVRGAPVVLLKESRIFEKPNAPSSGTGTSFYAGTMLILSDFNERWVKLTSKGKERVGWVEAFDDIAVEPLDIEVAGLYEKAMALTDRYDRKRSLNEIKKQREYRISPVYDLVEAEIENIRNQESLVQHTPGNDIPQNNGPVEPVYFPNGEDDVYAGQEDDVYTEDLPAVDWTETTDNAVGDVRGGENLKVRLPSSQIVEKEVFDFETGQITYRIIETGTIQPVEAKKPKTQYYAYHKTLPIGSKILLEIPGGRGFLPLEVIARLKSDNPHCVGLNGQVIREIFGEIAAKDVASVTITYQRP
ncbi:hypothetical protein [Pontibacter sp. G13]|uniref:hypothetical protein n=1 Tax=Pontibacter sp. G13 TaxID=3074898 RepID=UPI0028890311|nr:hypothetical protein [Pontibacter sp. G13]WNJ16333.1 hypothetical protein RJD25_15825 [Pontibacter sp. G13]